MNHDYAHCWDYEKGVCPEECFRGKLTDDLKNWPHPVTYSKFKGTEACPLTNPQPKRTHGDVLRSSTDEELAQWLANTDACPEDRATAYCVENECDQCWLDYLRGVET